MPACCRPREEVQGYLRSHHFLRAVVVVLVVSVIILIHFVVVIFSLRMHAQQVFSALFTGVLNTIVCI